MRRFPSNGKVTAATVHHLRTKTARIARILESAQGQPRQALSLPRPLDMLVATILSQNTNDKNSHRAYVQLRSSFPRWEDVAEAPVPAIIRTIRVGGMANQKAPRIRETLQAVRKRFGRYSLIALEDMTSDQVIEELTQINGVGIKTAACVLLFAMGRDVFPVDTHVHRICGRLGLAPGCTTPEKTFRFMQALVPKGKGYSLHTNLIRFGRRICRSNNPVCAACPLYDECIFPGRTRRLRPGRPASKADHDFMVLDNVGVAR